MGNWEEGWAMEAAEAAERAVVEREAAAVCTAPHEQLPRP